MKPYLYLEKVISCDNCMNDSNSGDLFYIPENSSSREFNMCRECIEAYAEGDGLTFEDYCKIHKVEIIPYLTYSEFLKIKA